MGASPAFGARYRLLELLSISPRGNGVLSTNTSTPVLLLQDVVQQPPTVLQSFGFIFWLRILPLLLFERLQTKVLFDYSAHRGPVHAHLSGQSSDGLLLVINDDLLHGFKE